jgi:hypothetical protein
MNIKRTLRQNFKRSLKITGLVAGILFALFVLLVVLANTVWYTPPTRAAQPTAQAEKATTQPTMAPTPRPTSIPTIVPTATAQPVIVPTAVPTKAPTPKPVATITPAQLEAVYKLSTTDTTVADIDKNGASGSGSDQHFTSTIVNFVKDASGNTGGANVSSPDGTSIIQVIFTPGTDLSQLNVGDTLEVWGTNMGVFSGSNAFGSTIQEVGIQANYMTDQTTDYQANS